MSFSILPRSLILVSIGIILGTSATYILINNSRPEKSSTVKEDIVDGVQGLIGNTKLVRINSLSKATGCEILAKAEVHPLPNLINSF
jgi:cysteine synthase A